ncbi:MAG: hypothetical protein HY455_03420 [Parcubacteria group bacterium]|nr:hypothetical protein [Parcubacteria group bacterium]
MGLGIFFILTLFCVVSPIFLPLLPKGKVDLSSLSIGGGVFLGAAFIASLFRLEGIPANVLMQFLFFQFLLFFSFIAVSRMRQRKSQFLHALTSIPSNGQWFITMWILSEVYLVNQYAKGVWGGLAFTEEFLVLLVIAVAGALSGRLVGAQWMQWVEARWEVNTESVGSAGLRKLDKYTSWYLWGAVLKCLAVYLIFFPQFFVDVLIVMSLGLVQNGVYAINTRLANRDHPGWPVVTGLIGSVVFVIHWAFLISYTTVGGVMPLILLVPYTIATVAGSNFGALLSMGIERALKLKADAHVKGKDVYKTVTWHKKLLWVTAILTVGYVIWNTQILSALGIVANDIVLPVPLIQWLSEDLVRPAALAIGGLLFFLVNMTHTLSSRAGNRNHAGYHAVTCIPHGIVHFSMGTFVILNAHFVDLIPLAMLGAALGQLWAQELSKRVEKYLTSVMDVPPEPKKA